MKERIIVLILVAVSVAVLIFTDFGQGEKVYDCRLAEFHPDFPPKIKEECRRLMREHYQYQQEQQRLKNYI